MKKTLYALLFLVFTLASASHAETVTDFSLDDPEFDDVLEMAAPSAEEFANSYKVLGRGLENRKTGASLQLACVGGLLEGVSGEANCRTLQFLLTDPDGSQRLIGQKMTFGISDKLTRRTILRELRAQGLAAPKEFANTYQASRVFYGGEGVNGAPAIWLIFGTLGGSGVSSSLFAGGVATFSLPIIAGTIVFLSIPLMTDLIRLPFQMRKARREFGYLFGKMGPNITVKALEDRSKLSWQLKPKQVAAKGFDRFVDAIESEKRNCSNKHLDSPCEN